MEVGVWDGLGGRLMEMPKQPSRFGPPKPVFYTILYDLHVLLSAPQCLDVLELLGVFWSVCVSGFSWKLHKPL